MKLKNASVAETAGRTGEKSDDLEAEFLGLTKRDRLILEFLGMGCLDGVWYWDMEDPARGWISPQFWEFLGYDPAARAPTRSSWLDVLHADDHVSAHRNFEKLAANPDQPIDTVLCYHHANGSLKWVRRRGVALRRSGGRVARVLGVHIDVTELKQAQQDIQTKGQALKGAAAELRRRETELQFIFDNLPVRIWYKDDKSRVLRLNEPAANSLGMTVAEAESEISGESGLVDDAETAQSNLAIMNSLMPVTDTVERHDPRTGKYRWVRTDKIPYIDRTLGRRTLLIVEADVTELKVQERVMSRLNAELDRQRQLYLNLYQRTPVMMYSISDEGRILEVSDLWLQKFGYSRNEVIGRKSLEFLDETSQKHAREIAQPIFWRDGFIKDIPYRAVHKDGWRIEVELSSIIGRNPITGRSNALTVMVDVSDRNAAFEEASRQNAELETIRERMEQFVRAASYDLREPVRKIQVFSDVLAHHHAEKLEGDGRYALETIISSAQRMNQLIRDLLDYSLLRNRKMVNERLELGRIIGQLADELYDPATGTQVPVTIEDAPAVRGDQGMVRQLFAALFANALKFRHPERAPAIGVSFIPDPSGGGMLCFVSDNGIGFDPDYSWKMFEPFERLHDRDIATGSGIGLAVCKAICERHGWSIWTENTSEDGSVLAIRIPAGQVDGDRPE
jgi:PAS domain S-box-containing protein